MEQDRREKHLDSNFQKSVTDVLHEHAHYLFIGAGVVFFFVGIVKFLQVVV